MRPLAFSLLRELSHEHFVSGARLAEKYGVSRSAVSDALRDATDAGIGIFSLTRKGYRLAEPIELLDLARIHAALGATAKRVDVEVLATIDSTNTELMRRATLGAPSGMCLAAVLQTAGGGGRGRVWHSALGASLTFSLLWRFDKGAAQLGGLSLAVGLAVLRALRTTCNAGLRAPHAIALKWPNDIVAGNAKLAGVMVETQCEMLGPTNVVIGVGINLNLSDRQKKNIDQPSTDLGAFCDQLPSRNLLLAQTLQELVLVLDTFGRTGFTTFTSAWVDNHALHGKPVRVLHVDGSTLEGIAKGVAEDGALVVSVRGKDQRIASAEVSLRGPK
ncbi:MAG: biotin--[acetyl-CoA-carboxylase] ligase [Burkholderiales bacterium]|nr:biotin--[acetyl-CoA-carboxylase] ligase [Burkholderiales bacterium]